MDEKEKLYVELMMLPDPDSCEAREFKNKGYLTEEQQHTQKALDYLADFINSKSDQVFQAITEAGPGARRSEIMKCAGITQFGVFIDVANKMVLEGRLKKQSGNYYPVS